MFSRIFFSASLPPQVEKKRFSQTKRRMFSASFPTGYDGIMEGQLMGGKVENERCTRYGAIWELLFYNKRTS